MRILFALSRFPLPAHTGDRLRAFQQIESLASRHDVHVVCLSPVDIPANDQAALERLVSSLTVVRHRTHQAVFNLVKGLAGQLPLQVQLFRSPTMQAAIDACITRHEIEIVVSQLVRISPNVPPGSASHVIDYVDALSLGLDRRVPGSSWPMRMALRLEAKRMAQLESRVGRLANRRVVTSPIDAEHLQRLGTGDVDVIPVGVGESFFDPGPLDQIPGRDFDVLFTGNLGYAPNVLAAEFLVNEIRPRLLEFRPDLTIGLVGARPHRRVRRLACSSVQVAGPVDDIRPFLRQARVAIAPMLTGSGVQLKILQSLAMGVPTVTTPLANGALGATPGQHLLVGSDAQELAQAVHSLLSSQGLATRIGADGRAFVAEHFRWAQVNGQFEEVLASALRDGP